MLAVKIGDDSHEREPELSFFMGVASPLRFGHDVLEMALTMLRLGQAVGIGGNCVAGIQAPITPAADIAVDHAERLAGLCIVTSIRTDARFYFCNHTYSLDMQAGDVAHGSPEMTLQALLGQKLLEHCGFRLVVNHPILDTSAHAPDAQAAAEKMMYMLLTALGGAQGNRRRRGLKENLCYEQLVIDNEIAGYVRHLLKGAVVNDETIAVRRDRAARHRRQLPDVRHYAAVPPRVLPRRRTVPPQTDDPNGCGDGAKDTPPASPRAGRGDSGPGYAAISH